MITFLDQAVNTFFINAGGLDFLGFMLAIVVIYTIIISLIRPLEV